MTESILTPTPAIYDAYFGNNTIQGLATISQTFSLALGTYDLSYYLANGANCSGYDGGCTQFTLNFGGAVITNASNQSAFGYTLFQNTLTATGGPTTLSFSFLNDPDFFYLDDVSLVRSSPSPVPEPGTLMLMGSGLLGLAGAAKRKLFA